MITNGSAGSHVGLIETLPGLRLLSALDPMLPIDPRLLLVSPDLAANLKNAPAPTAAALEDTRRAAQRQAWLIRMGTQVANGTSSPSLVAGISLHLALRAAGTAMTNHEALQTVTINAAKAACADQHLGTLEVGKLADLVGVRGDPLIDLKSAADTAFVLKNGIYFTTQQILAPYLRP